jgi:hypothetical protein
MLKLLAYMIVIIVILSIGYVCKCFKVPFISTHSKKKQSLSFNFNHHNIKYDNFNRYNNILEMERGLIMLLHAIILAVLLYIIMVFVLGQRTVVAEDRSILIAALVLIYMLLFGHGLPTSINKNIM